ncbi:MAG: hypothetical protein ABI867_38480 [Kofleriaceae bacterium]
MRPHAVELSSPVLDITFAGSLAALLPGRIEFLDDDLAPGESVSLGESVPPQHLTALDDGRLIAHQKGTGALFLGRRGSSFEPVAIGEERLAHGFVPTPAGFVAWTAKTVVVDLGGERITFEHPTPTHGGTRWGDRVVLATPAGLYVIGADGSQQKAVERPVTGRPAGFGTWLAVPDATGIAILDEELNELERLPATKSLRAWGDGVLRVDDHALAYWDASGRAWSFDAARSLRVFVAGDHLVIGSGAAAKAWIFDRGGLQAEVALAGVLAGAAAFADGLALIDDRSHAATWWRPGALEELPHDFTPTKVVTIPSGLASVDANVVYVWRTDRDGPEVAAAPDNAPALGTPIVAAGAVVTIAEHGRFASRGKRPDGSEVRIPNTAAWRPAITREAARPVLDQLLQRRLDGELPPDVSPTRTLDETVPLHARAMFQSTSLDEAQLSAAAHSRTVFFAELGAAFDVSGRVMLAAARSRKFPLEPPRAITGYEYLGSFATNGDVVVCDPSNVGQRNSSRSSVSVVLRVAGKDGLWHVFAKPAEGLHTGRTAELVVVHSDGFAVAASEQIGSIGVDAGHVGVFDKACPKPQPPYDEGGFLGQGAIAVSGIGDGVYPVFAGSLERKVVKVRVRFLGDSATDLDSTVATVGVSRRYSASERFAIGDSIEHPKFGQGTVVKINLDGKIDVMFGSERRVLVHARK